MKTKSDVAHTVAILLGIRHWEKLMKLDEETLNEMYRNYIKNAKEYNHLEDETIQLRTEVLTLTGELRRARKS